MGMSECLSDCAIGQTCFGNITTIALNQFNFKMAAAAILDCAESEFLQQNRLWDTVFSPFAKFHAKFHANISHIVRDIAFKPIFKMAAAAILDFVKIEFRW